MQCSESASAQVRRPWFVEAGIGDTVIAVHGAISDYRFFEPQLEELSRRWRFIALSLTGYHPGTFDPAEFSAAAHASEIEALLASLECTSHLVGHSRGGRIALHVAARRPDLVRSLTLIEPGGVMDAEFLAEERWPAPQLVSLKPMYDPEQRVASYVEAGFGTGAWQAAPYAFRHIAIANARTMDGSLADMSLPLSRAIAGQVKAPTLLIDGSASPAKYGAICDALEMSIPMVTRLRVDGADHFMTMNRPDTLNTTLAGFFEAIDAKHNAVD